MKFSRTKLFFTLLTLSFLIALFFVAYPMYVIRPFRAQGPRELAAALAVLRYGSGVTGFCAGLGFAMWFGYVSLQESWPWRILASVTMLAVCGLAWLSNVNVYEHMFHPMGTPRFESAAQSKLNPGEMVIAVRVNGQARAYPIRVLAYHHIANDVVAGVPIVATY